jgi:hypothetical protein
MVEMGPFISRSGRHPPSLRRRSSGKRKGRGCAPPYSKETRGPLGGALDTAPVLREFLQSGLGALARPLSLRNPGLLLGILDNDVCCLFTDHIDRANDEISGYARKHRGVDDS